VILNLIRRHQKLIRSFSILFFTAPLRWDLTVSNMGTVRILTHVFGLDCFLLHVFLLNYSLLFTVRQYVVYFSEKLDK